MAKALHTMVGDTPVTRGQSVLYGIAPHFVDAPITNMPTGAVELKRRIRAHEMAKVFIQTQDGAKWWYYAGPDGPKALRLLWPMGVNK